MELIQSDTRSDDYSNLENKNLFRLFSQPLGSHIQIFGTLGQLLKIPPFSAHSSGGRVGPQFFFGWNPSIFVS